MLLITVRFHLITVSRYIHRRIFTLCYSFEDKCRLAETAATLTVFYWAAATLTVFYRAAATLTVFYWAAATLTVFYRAAITFRRGGNLCAATAEFKATR